MSRRGENRHVPINEGTSCLSTNSPFCFRIDEAGSRVGFGCVIPTTRRERPLVRAPKRWPVSEVIMSEYAQGSLFQCLSSDTNGDDIAHQRWMAHLIGILSTWIENLQSNRLTRN